MHEEQLAEEFARVVGCNRCSPDRSPQLIRDDGENVPQPGYVGRRYAESRVLLVGQNPGMPLPRLTALDAEYTGALRAIRDQPGQDAYAAVCTVLERFVPEWPIHGAYFPLEECGLALDQVAYCNLVRCRTRGNAAPGERLARECASAHFERWLSVLEPAAVVFLGKWAHRRGSGFTDSRGIPSGFIDRDRSLNREQRTRNRAQVAELVRSARVAA